LKIKLGMIKNDEILNSEAEEKPKLKDKKSMK